MFGIAYLDNAQFAAIRIRIMQGVPLAFRTIPVRGRPVRRVGIHRARPIACARRIVPAEFFREESANDFVKGLSTHIGRAEGRIFRSKR